MCVSEDKKQAIVGWYRVLNEVNAPYSRIRLQGLDPDLYYHISGTFTGKPTACYGDELMYAGLSTSDTTAGELPGGEPPCCDFDSRIYLLKAD